MKKRWIGLTLGMAFSLSLIAPTFAMELPPAQQVTNEESKLEILAEEATATIDEDVFGGYYFDDNGCLVYCVTEPDFSVPVPASADQNIIIKTVKYSLAELESMKEALEPYMAEYDIVTLDADESTNKVVIEAKEKTDELMTLLDSLLDSDDYVLIEMPDDFSIETTLLGPIPVTETVAAQEDSSITPAASLSVLPGMKIYVGDNTNRYICTAGPRNSDKKFYTCGHVLESFVSYAQGVYEGTKTTTTRRGTTSNRVFGAGGDRCDVTVSGVKYGLPSSNINFEGNTYTYGSPVSGRTVSMHGCMSGISAGKITGTNLTVSVDGTTVKGLGRADYTCQKGDSGAGVFTTGTSSCQCVGIQSAGTSLTGNTYKVSYFSPLPGF